MNEKLPISIGVCAYNEEKNIERTIRAIFDQELENVVVDKIFVVSSGSTDRTDEIVTNLSEEYPNLMLLPQAKREGKNSAINLILETKQTEIVVLLNADNVFAKPTSLQELLLPFFDKKVGMSGGRPIPTNDNNTIAGYATNLIWSMHHHISLTDPKIGELVAFRDIGTKLPLDMQSDEDILRMNLENKGYDVRYCPEATIFNRGPETIRDYIKQRKRVNIGEAYLVKKFNYRLPTHNPKYLFSSLLESIKELGFHPFNLLCSLILEEYVRFAAKLHVSMDKGDMNVWEQVTTTKKL